MILKTLELLKSEADPRALKNVLEMRNKQKNAPIIVSKDCKRVRQNINTEQSNRLSLLLKII